MIVKIKYFKSRQQRNQTGKALRNRKPATLKDRVKANARYIAHRSGKDGEKMSREYFGHDGKLTKEQVYSLIDTAAKGTYFYKLVISPDPKGEDGDKALDLREITLKTIEQFEATIDKRVQFFAAIHNADHTPKRHIHAVVLVEGRLSREVFTALPADLLQAAREEALSQRDKLGRELGQAALLHHTPPPSDGRLQPGGRALLRPTTPMCPLCGMPLFAHGICVSCGFSREQERQLEGVRLSW